MQQRERNALARSTAAYDRAKGNLCQLEVAIVSELRLGQIELALKGIAALPKFRLVLAREEAKLTGVTLPVSEETKLLALKGRKRPQAFPWATTSKPKAKKGVAK